ncbi:MAG: hypothetical protein LBQ20_00355 [Rhodanobacter sp.]|jgi:hypothetical protein|nr:hypothetical protein [Rhodanobacter sp.]
MPHKRKTEVNVLGYRIDSVRKFDECGEVSARWYEVLAPESMLVLGTFTHRVEAEREIVARELGALPRRMV